MNIRYFELIGNDDYEYTCCGHPLWIYIGTGEPELISFNFPGGVFVMTLNDKILEPSDIWDAERMILTLPFHNPNDRFELYAAKRKS